MRYLLIVAAILIGAWDSPQRLTTMPGAAPRSPGFLPSCSTTLSPFNYLEQSANVAATPWNVSGVGGSAAPTVTANSVTAPDGTATAARIVYPAVSVGGTDASVVFQPVTNLNTNTERGTTSIWLRGNAGGEVVWLIQSWAGSGSGYTAHTKAVLTTSWQRFSVSNWLSNPNTQYTSFGVDLRDAGETAQGAQTIFAWGANLTLGKWLFPYVATTTSQGSQTYAMGCPSGLKFRDFSQLVFWSGNPITPQNTQTYNAGGTSNPYVTPWARLGGTYYAFANCAVAGADRGRWGQCLYTGTDPLHWTNYSGNPLISAAPGQWDDNFLLHAVISPVCALNTYCAYYMGRSAGGVNGIGLVSASSPTGPWTKYAGNPLSTLFPSSIGPGEPWPILIGNTLYLYTSWNNDLGQEILYWKSPVTDGINFTFGGFALFPPQSGIDWDFGFNYIDPHVFKNKYGFYEMGYTAFNSTTGLQNIGYAVSQDGEIWYKRQDAPILTHSSRGDPNSIQAIGDTTFVAQQKQFYFLWNYDDATSVSQGNASLMPDN